MTRDTLACEVGYLPTKVWADALKMTRPVCVAIHYGLVTPMIPAWAISSGVRVFVDPVFGVTGFDIPTGPNGQCAQRGRPGEWLVREKGALLALDREAFGRRYGSVRIRTDYDGN